jgi:hypothetical protein
MPWDFRRGGSAAKPAAKPSKPANPECDPNYKGACIPPFSKVGDLNCGDVSASGFQSIGADPHRMDGDGDGVACE